MSWMPLASPWARPLPWPPICCAASASPSTPPKLDQKYYRHHSGWVGGLKEVKYRTLMSERPELAMKLAVRGMMPRNVITKDSLSRLHIYRGGEHEHAAQKPEVWAAE